VRLGADPLAELVAIVAPDADQAQEVRNLRRDAHRLSQLLDVAGGTSVLVIDRFEQLFQSAKHDQVGPLIDNLLYLVAVGRHRLILTLRSDYLAHAAAIERFGEVLERGRVYIAFTTRELRRAIEEPAKKVGLNFEMGLVDRLLLDVQGEPEAASLL